MNGKRIIILGCSGSGKSTLSVKLGQKLGIPVIHLDKLYWRTNWQHISAEEFDANLTQELIKNSWIIDGNYNRTIPLRLTYCDTVIYLDYSRITCLLGALKRVLFNYRKNRSDMGKGCPEKFDWEFLTWIWNFNRENRDNIIKILKESRNKQIYIFKTRKECAKFTDKWVK